MDPSQRWETEALRESRERQASRPAVSQRKQDPVDQTTRGDSEWASDEDWVTLREASDETGIPQNTLRKWARRKAIDSYLESDGEVNLRMVSMAAVLARAAELGRAIGPADVSNAEAPGGATEAVPPVAEPVPTAPVAVATPEPTPPEAEPADEPEATDEPQAAEELEAAAEPTEEPEAPDEPEARREAADTVERDRAGEAAPDDAEASPAEDEDLAPGTMLVPIDAWNKMLLQLGNLHEAGQQLAEARERAAKAETEASFLRERLTEIRTANTAEDNESAGSAPPTPQAADRVPTDPPAQKETTRFWRYIARGWRRRTR